MCFLGKSYSLPYEVYEYVNYMNWFSPFYVKAMEPLEKHIRSNGDEWRVIDWKKEYTSIAYELITELAKHNAYNVTVEDFIDNNIGYIKLSSINEDCNQKAIEILKQAATDYMNQQQNAYNQANSRITGTGTTVFTSDPLAYMVFANRETNAINRQIAQANAEYRNAIDRLNRSNANWVSARLNKLKLETYCSACAEAINLFAATLFSTFMEALNDASAFNYDAIRLYDLDRSSSLLNNFQHVSDKAHLLREAFEVCPYNGKVFDTALAHGIVDGTFLAAADCIGFNISKESIINACKNLQASQDFTAIIESISKYYNLPTGEIRNEVFSLYICRIERAYDDLNKLLVDQDNIRAFVQGRIAASALSFVKTNVHEIQSHVNKYVDERFSAELIDTLIRNELQVEYFDGSQKAEEIRDRVKNRLYKRVIQFQREIQDIYQQYTDQINDLSTSYTNIINQQEEEQRRITKELSVCETQRQELGIFSGSKKKELDKKIAELTERQNNYDAKRELKQIDKKKQKLIMARDEFSASFVEKNESNESMPIEEISETDLNNANREKRMRKGTIGFWILIGAIVIVLILGAASYMLLS